MMGRLVFRPVDPVGEAALLIAFGRDLLRSGTGSDARFVAKFGADGAGYARWISEKLAADPQSVQFACAGGTPIGMVAIGRFAHDGTIGWVNHFYLTAANRGSGLGGQLEAKAVDLLRRRGFRTVRLAVSESNQAARRFYDRHGWRDAGPRPEVPGHRYMEKAI